ncbi:MAG: leucine-rich repeat domain-containing protein [Prevotella sp.]|nr:leucine-rich repeat domain-containing protein [Prevotella sp.]
MKTCKKEMGLVRRALLSLMCIVIPSVAWAEEWNDGVFVYNTQYTQSTGKVVTLSEGEVAISLYLDSKIENVKDTVYYTPSSGGGLGTFPSQTVKNNSTMVGQTVTYNSVKYTFLGKINDSGFVKNAYLGSGMSGACFYCREYTLSYSGVEDVVIPATVEHNGTTYKVVAIQKWGFCYSKATLNPYTVCSKYAENYTAGKEQNPSEAKWSYNNINDHSNDYLKTVTFENPSNLRSIGDYAFMSCNSLESVQIPNTVEYMGEGIFECDKKLADVRFQTVTDEADEKFGQVRFTTIKNWTFWFCTGLESLELPDGITTIEGTSTGAAMQYMTSLTSVRLPNTLTTVGPHFLCCAQSLKTLVVPASVTDIAGACFHGCENLSEVYLLGQAASLQKAGTGSDNTFGANNAFCMNGVSDCTFYVTSDYYSSYASHGVWKEIKEPNSHGNKLSEIKPETRLFAAGTWVTAIFPNGVTNYKSDPNEQGTGGFGANARVAQLTNVEVDSKNSNTYHMTFTLIDGDDIPAATPVMICPSAEGSHEMYTEAQAASVDFKKEMSKTHAVLKSASNGATVSMNGQYVDYTLLPWDFYFNKSKFWRVSTSANAPKIRQCRCYWSLNVDGIKTDPVTPTAAIKSRPTDVNLLETDAVSLVVDGIYDLNGRKLDIPQSALPQGMYIVNGKKLIVK